MANGSIVEPAAPPVAIEPTEPQPKEDAPAPQGSELSEEVLRLPAMGPLLAGSPPALSLKISDMAKTQDGKTVAKNFSALQAAGIFAYRALDKTTGVLGNSLYIAPESIAEADKAGQLASVATDWNLVAGEASRAGLANPAVTATEVPGGPVTAPAPAVPQASSGSLPPPPASAQRQLAGARSRNLQEGSPTSGRAAQGRLLNNLLKPAI